jgi:hypothetical protein
MSRHGESHIMGMGMDQIEMDNILTIWWCIPIPSPRISGKDLERNLKFMTTKTPPCLLEKGRCILNFWLLVPSDTIGNLNRIGLHPMGLNRGRCTTFVFAPIGMITALLGHHWGNLKRFIMANYFNHREPGMYLIPYGRSHLLLTFRVVNIIGKEPSVKRVMYVVVMLVHNGVNK